MDRSKVNGRIENKRTDLAGADYLATIPHAPWPSRSNFPPEICFEMENRWTDPINGLIWQNKWTDLTK